MAPCWGRHESHRSGTCATGLERERGGARMIGMMRTQTASGRGVRAPGVRRWSAVAAGAMALAACGLAAMSPIASGQPGLGSDERARFDPDGSAWARPFEGVQTFTKPSRDSVMGFNAPTSVVEILVRGGELVSQGQLLIRGNDAEQIAIVKQTRLRAESALQVERAQKAADLTVVEFESTLEAFDRGGGSQFELDRSRLSMETARIDVESAKLNQDLERVRLEQAEALLEQLRIVAPFDGIVEEVGVELGRSIDRAQPAVRVVSIDPLWIDVPAPAADTIRLGLSAGDSAWVLVDSPERRGVLEGRIIEVSPVADYASRSRRVRVEVENPEGLPPGLRVWVRFTEPSGDMHSALGLADREVGSGAGGGR
ncbi:MAG: HlyD family efflux transporter periplasmic adaptor subunit [Phycisphaerales bacterium]|nr:MAG: HlyD family efflux transporter periplasmic adaptor subunit [Phycisphaerales bacterium]